MTTRKSASKIAPSEGALATDVPTKGYVDTRSAILPDTDGVPLWVPGSGGTAPTQFPGAEIGYSATTIQTNMGDNIWTDVEGLDILVATDIPSRINLNLGVIVLGPIDNTVARGVEYRILNATAMVAVAYATLVLPPPVSSYSSQGTSPISGRLDVLPSLTRFTVQVKTSQAGTGCYVVPTWLPDARAELFIIGV